MVRPVALDPDEQDGQTPLDPEETAGLVPRHIETKGALNEWEQENILQATRWLRRAKVPEVLSEEFIEIRPSLPFITVASEHAVSICRTLRYRLQRIPMLDKFSLVVKSEDVHPGVVVVTRPMLLAMKHHE